METKNSGTVLITGASSGIGEALANEFARKGYNLILVSRNKIKIEEIADRLITEYKIICTTYKCDLSIAAELDSFLYFLHNSNTQNIEIVVNNAGVGVCNNFHEISFESYKEIIELNITALTRICHYFLPTMLQAKKGGIINVASTGAFQPVPYWAVYCATKSYVLDFTEALWGEYHKQGLKFLALCPGDTRTNFHNIAGSDQKGLRHDTAQKVAEVGVKAFFEGVTTKIVGKDNYLQSNISRFFPRKTVIKIVAAKTKNRILQKLKQNSVLSIILIFIIIILNSCASNKPIFENYTIKPTTEIKWAENLKTNQNVSVKIFNTGLITGSTSKLLNLKSPNATTIKSEKIKVQDPVIWIHHKIFGDYLIDAGLNESFLRNEYGTIKGPFKKRAWPADTKTVLPLKKIITDNNIKPKGILFTHLHPGETAGLRDINTDSIQLIAGKGEKFPDVPLLFVSNHYSNVKRMLSLDFTDVKETDLLGKVIDFSVTVLCSLSQPKGIQTDIYHS
jgi:uncharacterized protein